MSQGLGLFDPVCHLAWLVEVHGLDVAGVQEWLCHQSALRLPGIFLAKVTTIRNQHQ